MRTTSRLTMALLAGLSLFVTSCNDDNIFDRPPQNLKTGPMVDVSTTQIGTAGGTVTVSDPSLPFDGLGLTVPANAYAAPQSVKISYGTIESHDLGPNFQPITPVINVRIDGGYAAKIMELTIPVEVPSGHIPLAFYYDTETGKLEGIPLKSADSRSVTLLTRHFLSGNMLRNYDTPLKSGTAEKNGGASIIISSVSESLLNAQPVIASGFKPGTDDWEFTNYGSYIASGGHCAGQNMAAMWYYFEKKASDGNLFNKFSDNAAIWQDNARGYRFCSVIHADLDWEGTVSGLFDKYIDKNQDLDRMKLLTIAGTMLVTGEPQGIGIYRQTGVRDDGTPRYGGHDLICYQVSVSGGKLYISDPNTPATPQTIDFANDKFSPYVARANGNAAARQYPYVTWYAKTAYIEWNRIGNRYQEVLDNTIGTRQPNTFPEYTIRVKEGAGFDLKDGMVVEKDTLKTVVVCPTAEVYYNVENQRLIKFVVFNAEGARVDRTINKYTSYVKLKPGHNRLGYFILGWRSDSKDDANNYIDQYVDFKWINVYYSTVRISPDPIAAEPGKEVKITAETGGSAPKDAKYVWDFGDGTREVTVRNDSTVVHKFPRKGDFNVNVKLYDNASGKLVAEANAEANVMDGILSDLQKCKWVSLVFNADMDCNNPIVCFSGIDVDNEPPWQSTVKCPLTWNGTRFSADYAYSYETLDGEQISYSGTISGEVSANGLIVKSFNGTYVSKSNGGKDSMSRTIGVKDVPYDPTYEYKDTNPRFVLEGAAVKPAIVNAASSWSGVDSWGDPFSIILTGINYDDPEDVPYLHVSFFGMYD